MDDDFLDDDDSYIPPPPEANEEQTFEGEAGLDPSVVKVAEEHQGNRTVKEVIRELLNADLDLPGGLILINAGISYVDSYQGASEGVAFETAVSETLDALTGGAFYKVLDRTRIEQRIKTLEFAKYNTNSTLMYLEDGDYLDDDNLSKTKHYTTAIMAVIDHALEESRDRYKEVCSTLGSVNNPEFNKRFEKLGEPDPRILGDEPMARLPERFLDYNDVIDKLFYSFSESDAKHKEFVEKNKDKEENPEEELPGDDNSTRRVVRLNEPEL